MKKIFILLLAALVIPSIAVAKPPKPAPQVTYELKGALSNYTAYNAATSTNGSITIAVTGADHGAGSLKGQSITFVVDKNTKIELHKAAAIANGDDGKVFVEAADNIAPAALAATLQASPAAKVHDDGVKPVPMGMYELHGTLSNYTAYNAATSTNGSITILVQHANKHGKSLKGATLTFVVDANTKFRFADHVTAFANGDNGDIKVKAPKKIAPASLAATLQLSPASSILDKGPKK
jgi:hypothetical protein